MDAEKTVQLRVVSDSSEVKQLTRLIQGPYKIDDLFLTKVPRKKGLYFWFVDGRGLELLSRKLLVKIPPNQFLSYGEYYLVYIGTAGTKRNGGSDLVERFKWHIHQKHTNSNIGPKGTLSTLRKTLGCLLGDHLLDALGMPAEKVINQFMGDHSMVGFIPFENRQEVNDMVNCFEDFLISSLRPILNLPKGRLPSRFQPVSCKDHIRLRRRYVVDRSVKQVMSSPLKPAQ